MSNPYRKPRLTIKEYQTVTRINGPLIYIDRVSKVAYDEMVEIISPDGEIRLGRVMEVDGQTCLVQVFVGTDGLDLAHTRVRFSGHVGEIGVSLSMLGRILNSAGEPLDEGPQIIAEMNLDIAGLPINPYERVEPREFIQTGISAIDGLNTLARGQKLPIFSEAGLPGNELAAQIVSQARVIGANGDEPFSVVFAAIGITHREAALFLDHFRSSGAMERTVVFMNYANDPTIERLLTARAALTTAEYLATKHNRHVLVIMTDMTNYCEALREVAAAREEIPGRRGYPGHMYSDLASLFERAGRLRGQAGSITQLIMLNMPDGDITHPIPDLTGYITEGQIVLSLELHKKGIYPPIDVLPSLSRAMNAAIGAKHTREDHRSVADQLYALYAEGRNLRRLVTIVGESALSREDQLILDFTRRFENEYINQGNQNRNIQETLELAWKLFEDIPINLLKRIPHNILKKYGGRKE